MLLKMLQICFIALILSATSVYSVGFSLDELISAQYPQQGTTHDPNDDYERMPASNLHSQSAPMYANPDPKFDPRISSIISNNIMDMSQDIMTTLIKSGTGDQRVQVFSPVSIAAALSLVLLGANGNTFQELSKLFHYNEDQQLSSTPYKVHEEFGLLLDDMIADIPNPKHPRPILTNWKQNILNMVNRRSEFLFPTLDIGPSSRSQQSADYTVQGRSSGDIDHKISVANGIFIQKGYSIRRDYRNAVQSVYSSELRTLDFIFNAASAQQQINEWVSDRTNGKIKNILSGPINPDTKIILASALYFNAKWEKTFFESATQTKNFYPNGVDGTPIPVEMMAHGGIFPYYESKELDCRIIGLPYKKNLTTMYVILPKNSNRKKLIETQLSLTAENIDHLISRMEMKTAVILFPKMHITSSFNMKTILKQLGVSNVFQPGQSDLSLIANAVPDASDVQIPISVTVPYFNPTDQLLFSRIAEEAEDAEKMSRKRRDVSYKVESSFKRAQEPLRLKDLIIRKRISKENPMKKTYRHRRDLDDGLKNLDIIRNQLSGSNKNPGLYIDEVVHKIDLTINEKGTEGGAATVVYLTKTGTDVVFRVDTPFIFLIRHDDTKLPIFYGTVFEPINI